MSNSSLANGCYNKIKSLIESCHIPPGTRVTEKELIASTGFGRTPVREALARLDIEGLIKTKPRSGYYVTPINLKTVSDLYDVFRLVAPLIVLRAAENFNDEYSDRLEDLMQAVEPNAPTENLVQNNRAIFDLLSEACDNPYLVFISDRLASEQRRIFTFFLDTSEGREWSISQRRFWQDRDWYKIPDVAKSRMTFAVTSSFSKIIEMLENEG